MSILAKHPEQIILFFDSRSQLGQKCYAHLAAAEARTQYFDLSETKIGGSEWGELAELLETQVEDLIVQEHPAFTDLFGDEKVEFEKHDAIKVLENNPEVLVYPIAVRGQKAIRVRDAMQLRKLIETDTGEVPQP